jgi:hypothetical protein
MRRNRFQAKSCKAAEYTIPRVTKKQLKIIKVKRSIFLV